MARLSLKISTVSLCFNLRTMVLDMGLILLFLCQPIKRHHLQTILSKTQIVWFKFQNLLGQESFTRPITE